MLGSYDSAQKKAEFCVKVGTVEWSRAMGLLFVTCPTTRLSISTGIDTTSTSLRRIWKSNMQVACSHCGKVHEFKVRDAMLASAISDEMLSGTSITHKSDHCGTMPLVDR